MSYNASERIRQLNHAAERLQDVLSAIAEDPEIDNEALEAGASIREIGELKCARAALFKAFAFTEEARALLLLADACAQEREKKAGAR